MERPWVGGAAVAIAIAALAASFAIPHGRSVDAAAPPVARWLGRLDGAARLLRVVEADGSTTWSSSTTEVVPDMFLLSLDAGLAGSVLARVDDRTAATYREQGRLPGVTLVREHVTQRPDSGEVRSRTNVLVLDADGYGLVGSLDARGEPEVFDPPLPLLPADPELGTTWEAAGAYGSGGAEYRFRGAVLADELRDLTVGGERFCLLVETELSLEQAGLSLYEQVGQEWWCDGLGPEGYEADAGEGVRRGELVGLHDHEAARRPSLEVASGEALDLGPPVLGDPTSEAWVRSSVGSIPSGIVTPKPTALPALADPAPGSLLVATLADDVVRAVPLQPDAPEAARWSVGMGSNSFGSPGVSTEMGMVVMGSTRGEVRASSLDGLVLWSTDVGDNVASRPLVIGGNVVVGSEDGSVVGLDAATGAIRWRTATGGPVVSWPAALGELAVIGGDDGVVRAIDPRDGTIAWAYDLGMPVEAAITVADGGAAAIGREGDVVLIDEDGSLRWATSTGGTATTGVTAVDDLVVAVAGGSLVALDVADGSLRWERAGAFVGPAAALSGRARIGVATRSGDVVALDGSGAEVERWPAPADATGSDRSATISIGVVAGAGALWLVDDDGSVQRVGPREAGVAEERTPAWVLPVGSEPFGTDLLRATPLVVGDDVVLVDAGGAMVRVDPATGEAVAAGRVDLGEASLQVSPAVADDVAYLAAGSSILAASLAGGSLRWRAAVPGLVVRPPVVAGDDLLVTSQDDDVHHLSALDRSTGVVRWSRPTGTVAVAFATLSPLLVVGDLVLAGDPVSAHRISDGEVVWRSETTSALGGAIETDDGVVVTLLSDTDPTAAPATVLVTLDPDDGAIRATHRLDGVFADGFVPLLATDAGVVILSDAAEDRLLGVEPSTGTISWEVTLPAERAGGAALLPDGLVWCSLVDGRVLAIDPDEGESAVRTRSLVDDVAASTVSQQPVALAGVVIVAAGMVALAVPGGGA